LLTPHKADYNIKKHAYTLDSFQFQIGIIQEFGGSTVLLNIDRVLSEEESAVLLAYIDENRAAFSDGKKTAGWQASGVKNNEQLDAKSARVVAAKVETALRAHPLFLAAARPKSFLSILVSRYRPGMEYGLHVDDALMGGIRTDLSFTLFLADPHSYDGGELVIEGNDGDSAVKLPAGSVVIYPTTALHRVAPVTRGERIAVVGWVRSFIRSPEQREVLFDLDGAIAAVRAAGIDRRQVDLLLKVRANLLRMWAED
jgi:PKHD-type hydroxylase